MNPVSNLSSAVSFQVSHSSIFRQVGEKFSWSWPVSGHGARSVETSKSDLLILLETDVTDVTAVRDWDDWGLIISTIDLEYEVWLSTYYYIILYHIISYYIILYHIIISTYHIHLSYPLLDSLEVFGFTALRRCRFSGCIPLVLSPVGSTPGKDRPTKSPKTAVKWCSCLLEFHWCSTSLPP